MSSELLYIGEGEIVPAPVPPAAESIELRDQIDSLLDKIHNHELRLAAGYVRLGRVLLDVRAGHHWREWGFRSFGSYIESLRARIDRGRSQIYQVISVTEKLLPFVEADVLESIGISKAGELKRFVTQTGRIIPEDLMQIAKDDSKGIDELRAAVFESMHQKSDPKGKYYDLGGFFCSLDEKAEIDKAFRIATMVDPVIPQDTPEPQQKLEILLRLAREFTATWEPILDTQ